ncbi:MAG: hypothetical protein MI974_02700 [Chitinophagales bacterium]|nr:hypothetical protein [Chitinophagales bacterium]
MYRTFMYFILPVLLLGCQAESDKSIQKPDLQKELPGTWEAVSVNVQINSAMGNPDSTATFVIEENEWLERLAVKPVRTYYLTDNKYRQEFKSPYDTLISVNRGMWNAFGDTLMMIEPTVTYQYTVELENGLIEFNSVLDWDGDGEEDDLYKAVHRKISIGVE